MKKTKENNYLRLECQDENITDFSSTLTKRHEEFRNDNVIIDIENFSELHHEHLLSFLEISDRHRMENKSFVIVNSAVDIDKISDELMVVPTLREAIDVIEMEEIERDLAED